MAHRVLVVDEKVEGLARIQAHLQPHGYAFTWALNADEALDTLVHEIPDVVLVDGALPGKSAIEFVSALRKIEASKHLPIVVTIERNDEERRLWTRRVGVDEVLEKPFENGAITICVRQLVRMKALRDDLERRKRELAHVYEGQRAFVEALVHDFKNPIAVVHVNLAWLADRVGTENTDLSESISDAREGIDRVQKMVDDLLMVGMLEQSVLPLKREFIRVTDLIDQAIKSHEKEAIARKVSFSVSIPESVGMVGDPAVLRRVVNNVIETSLRHTPSSGRIELSAKIGDSVEIAISNTGRRLDADEKAQLLDKSPPSSGQHGMGIGGLGLYLCRRAVEAHDGELSVVESDEWPTSVVMRFPTTATGS